MHFWKHRFKEKAEKLNSFPDLIARVDLSTAGNPERLSANQVTKQRICGSTAATRKCVELANCYNKLVNLFRGCSPAEL